MEAIRNKRLEYPWNLITIIVGDLLHEDVDRAEVERGLEHLLETQVPPETRMMLELKYRDGLSQHAIAEHFGLLPSRVGQIIRKATYRFASPKYRVFLTDGYTEGMKREKRRAVKLQRWREIEETIKREHGTFPEQIHDISDPYKRVDAILERGGPGSVWMLRLGTRITNILLRHHIEAIWHLCFYSEEDILKFDDCGEQTLQRIEDELYNWDLALDDGLLGSTEESLTYAEYAANACEAIREACKKGENENGTD